LVVFRQDSADLLLLLVELMINAPIRHIPLIVHTNQSGGSARDGISSSKDDPWFVVA
jgi:hypothetical protein